MDIEQEVLNKAGKTLFVGSLIVTLLVCALLVGGKIWFWHQVDQEVSYQMDKLAHTSFGDIVTRTEVRTVTIGLWSAKINIAAFHLTETSITLYINVVVRGEDTSSHSVHCQVTTTNGLDTLWSPWVKNNAGSS